MVNPEPSLYSYDKGDDPADEITPSIIPKLPKSAMTKDRIGETKKNLFDNTEMRRKTRAASTKRETATIDEEHAPFSKLTNRQKKRSARNELKVGELRRRATDRRPYHEISSDENQSP